VVTRDALRPALKCVCDHGRLFHDPDGCDLCACDGYVRRVVRCYACGRNVDRDPWPHHGFPCGHCDDVTLGLR
jgi:hypothetical protein